MYHYEITALCELSSIHWYAVVHFHLYEHEILVIHSLHYNSVLLIDLLLFCFTYYETILVLQFFGALQDTMLRSENSVSKYQFLALF